MPRHQRFWTDEELALAIKLAKEGKVPREIGEQLGRTTGSVLGKLQREGAAGYTPQIQTAEDRARYKSRSTWVRPSRAKLRAPSASAPRRFSWDQV